MKRIDDEQREFFRKLDAERLRYEFAKNKAKIGYSHNDNDKTDAFSMGGDKGTETFFKSGLIASAIVAPANAVAIVLISVMPI